MQKSTRVLIFGLWVLVLDSSTKYLYSISLKVAYSYSKLVYSTPSMGFYMSQNSGSCYWFFSSGSLFFFLLTQAEKKDLQSVKSLYFCVGQQKIKEKDRSKRTRKKNRYFGTCKPAICYSFIVYFF